MKSVLINLLLAATSVTLSAHADVITYAHANGWEAFGGTSDNNTPMCGMSSRGDGKWFGIKYFDGNEYFTIHLSDSKWRAKNGLDVTLSMQFDEESPWSATASSFHMPDGDAALEFAVSFKKIGAWVREFRDSDQLIVSFPNQSVEAWDVDLAGTNEITDHFVECLKAMQNWRGSK